jgi:hypothetical protein
MIERYRQLHSEEPRNLYLPEKKQHKFQTKLYAGHVARTWWKIQPINLNLTERDHFVLQPSVTATHWAPIFNRSLPPPRCVINFIYLNFTSADHSGRAA